MSTLPVSNPPSTRSEDACAPSAVPPTTRRIVRSFLRLSSVRSAEPIRHLCNGLANSTDFIHDWTPFLLVFLYFIFSTCIYMVFTKKLFEIFWFIYLFTNFYIASAAVIEAFLSIGPGREAREAVRKIREKNWTFPTPDDKLLMLDLIIVAYLPNEKDIIIDRIHYALNQIIYPKDRIRINIVYNTPRPMEPLESEMRELAWTHSHLRIIKVPKSSSKAENLNYFLSLETDADVIAIYDCDHYPHPYGPRWAMERFVADQTVDIVQGRCVIFNSKASILTRMIAMEFDKIYAVSHPGRASMWGFGLFCGSNGYWRASLLKELKMDESMLTEDIDSALRAFTVGSKCVHDLNVVSYELSPVTYSSFWKQRLRWAQGWTQASVRHLPLAVKKSTRGHRPFLARFGVMSLLLVREWTYYLVTQYCCLVLSIIIMDFPKSGSTLARLIFFTYPVSEWFFIISFICLLATLWITNLAKSEFVSSWTVIMFSVFYPIYLIATAVIGLYGHARQLTRYSNWNTTARG